MAFCGKCGAEVKDSKFCTVCGAEAVSPEQAVPVGPGAQQTDLGEKLKNLNDTADTTNQFEKSDIEQNKTMAILSYFGILVLIPIFVTPNSKFVRFHANQGLILFIIEVAFIIVQAILRGIIFAISWRLSFLLTIVSLIWIPLVILAILGIVNAVNGRAKELPIIGKIKILK